MLRQLINLMPICEGIVLGPERDIYNQDKPVWNSYSKNIAYIKITADRAIRKTDTMNMVGNLTNILMTYTASWNWASYNNSVVFNILSTMNKDTADNNLLFIMQVLNSSRLDMYSEDFRVQFNIRNVYLVDTTSIVLELAWTGWNTLIKFGFKSDSALKVSIIGTALDKSLFNIPTQFNNTCHKIQLNPIKGLPDGILTEKKLLNKNNIFLLYYKNIKYKGGKYNMLRHINTNISNIYNNVNNIRSYLNDQIIVDTITITDRFYIIYKSQITYTELYDGVAGYKFQISTDTKYDIRPGYSILGISIRDIAVAQNETVVFLYNNQNQITIYVDYLTTNPNPNYNPLLNASATLDIVLQKKNIVNLNRKIYLLNIN